MKRITYQLISEVNHGTEEQPNIKQIFNTAVIECAENFFEANLAIAQKEAYNGEFNVEDIEDPVTEPTQLDQLEAQVTYTAMMTDTLLEV